MSDRPASETCTCGRLAHPLPISGLLICPPCGHQPGRCLCDVVEDKTIGDVARLERAVQTLVEAHSQGLLTESDYQRIRAVLT